MSRLLPQQLIEELQGFDSPTVSNAIEVLAIRDRTHGFASRELRCQFPELKPMVGYAVTCTADSTTPGKARTTRLNDLFDAIIAMRKPVVVVIQDCGPDRQRSCFVGDIAAIFFQRLGSVGAVTDGGFRDGSGIRTRAPGFQVFSPGAVVSHGNGAFVEVGIPVKIAGLTIHPGDLLHGDESGLLSVPHDRIEAILEQAQLIRKTEQEWANYAQNDSFNLEEMKRRFAH
jgi:4-hydroxy-4-methyl-2-oxoglutarate aldolase